MSKASARWVPRLLSEDDCGQNQASYSGKLSDFINNLYDVPRSVRPIAGKMYAQNSTFVIFRPKFAWECKTYGRIHKYNSIAIDRLVFLLYKSLRLSWTTLVVKTISFKCIF